MKNFFIRHLMIISIFLIPVVSYADGLCNGKFVNPVTDVCWSCLFPMSIGSAHVVGSDNPDTDNPKSPICSCPGTPIRVGITLGYWEPIALVDVTRHPFCMVNLGGEQFNMGDGYGEGGVESANSDQNHSFYYVHWYPFPAISMLNIITDSICAEPGDFDIAFMEEFDPTWKDDELAFILNPEAILFGNPISQSACAEDSLQSLTGLPNDYLFWCAGSQGSMYPMSGFVQEHVGGVQASTLLAERMTYKLHRTLFLWDSRPEDGVSLCYTYPTAIIPKSRYRYQMVNPLPTVGGGGCHPFGQSTALWGANHEYPYVGEDFGYLIWRKRNCCSF